MLHITTITVSKTRQMKTQYMTLGPLMDYHVTAFNELFSFARIRE